MARDVAVILAAAGKSTRFKDPFSKKVFTLCSGKPVWQHSAQLFADHPRVGQIIMAIAPEDKDIVQEKFAGNLTMLGSSWFWVGMNVSKVFEMRSSE